MDYGARGRDQKPFNVLLSPPEREMLEWLSTTRDQSMTAVVREALRRMHEQERTAFIRRVEARIS